MSNTWQSQDLPDTLHPGLMGWLLVVLRGFLLVVLVFGGLLVLLFVRLFERPFFGANRPVTPHITQGVCRLSVWILGLNYCVHGRPMTEKGAVVSNHTSWLDIFVLNAGQRVYFVAKSEIANWPAIGWLARATGTVFIRRASRDAKAQKLVFESRLKKGHRLLFFPEGTSTDGLRILAFKPTLFQAFFEEGLRDGLHIQPATVVYRAPQGEDARFYGWWGDMDFAKHFLTTLASRHRGSVDVYLHPPVRVADFANRKVLAQCCEQVVRDAFSV